MELTAAQQNAIDTFWNQTEDGEFDFVDNVRVARKGNASEEAEYEAQREQGCCGFCDMELACDDGSTLLYGFNYGH
jgi:hypothetical protein